jgi:hypothetical protein
VHEAGPVRRDENLGAGLPDVTHLVGAHGDGHVGVLDRERAPEAAALLGVRQVDQGEPADGAEQPVRAVAQHDAAAGVAGGVVGDRVREVGPDVLDSEAVDEELAEVVDPRRDLLDVSGQARVSYLVGQLRELVADRPHAGGRRRDDGVVAGEGAQEAAHHRRRLFAVATVDVHLAAARLADREVDRHPEPLEQAHGGPAGIGEHRVVQTRDEQGDFHGALSWWWFLRGHCRSRPTSGRRPRSYGSRHTTIHDNRGVDCR